MLTLASKNGKRRGRASAPDRPGDAGFGVSWGVTLAAGFSCWLLAIRWVSGPGVFERLGLTVWELAQLYCAGCAAAGLAFDALGRVRHRALGAMLQYLALMLPPMVAIPLNMSLSRGRLLLPPGELAALLMVGAVGGGVLWFLAWREDRRAAPPSGSRPTLRLVRDVERGPSQG